MKLCLVEIEPIEFKGDDGKVVKKFKYLFLDKDNAAVKGYSEYGDGIKYEDRVIAASEFSELLAHEYNMIGKEWEGRITWRVAI